ncbi:adhesin [Burkholderia cenocepacia]|uniref:ESPR-type extended signal peptide-containing protein n=1 Tax=Burkholderia cenocepacia TaxID=95486 RepID=UPI000F5BE42C|nr:ESPR-type extended signal peptide-containing protein [Burkholderia cenocepacia]RQV08234.1 adhesin [Burkholderia cenocepacia]
MNKTYRSVWNAVTNTWTAAAETAKSHSKGSSRMARQAVIAIALGGASIGGAAAAAVCTAEDGSNGTIDAAGVCKATGPGVIGTMATSTELTDLVKFGIGTTGAGSATGTSAIALGSYTRATGNWSTAIGGATTADTNGGRGAFASGNNSVAIGAVSEARANSSVALGDSSLADRAKTVSVGAVNNRDGRSFTRQIVNVTAGTEDNDAVNLGQMNTALSKKVDDTFIQVKSGMYAKNAPAAAGDGATAIGANASAVGMSAIALGGNTVASQTDAIAIGTLSSATGNSSIAIGIAAKVAGTGSIALGRVSAATADGASALGNGASATHSNSVALGNQSATTRDNSVSVGSAALQRQVTNLAAGEADTDAVNVGQMNAGLSTTNASIAATNAALSTTNANLSTTNATLSTTNVQIGALESGLSTANTNISQHTAEISTINGKLSELSNGTLGLVQQATSDDDITVGAATGGTTVNFAGSAGDRKLTGIASGDVSATSTEAINGSQLHGVADSVASAIGGGATVKADGSISAPSFTVGDGSGGTKIVNSVGDVVTNLDGRVTTNEGDIKKLADDIGSGTLGLVQQASAGDDITVGAATGGTAVNFAGSAGNRKLTGIAAGDVSATSTEAINGSQLHGVADSVASAIGGGATVKADGSISAPSFTVGDGSGGTKIVNSVGDVVTNLDSRTTTNEGDIKKLANDIGSGTLGLVQQANPSGDITVGANSDGHAVNFSSKTGARTLTGVAAGDVSASSTDAVNGSQLHGVSDSVASAIGGGATVKADGSISAPSFTVGDGNGGTKIVNSVGDVVTNLDSRTTANEGDIKKLADDIGSGTLGLVQQANPSGDITVGANSDGHAVNFSSKTGARTLTGVAAGDVSAASADAVNGGQLHGVSNSVASALGGTSTVGADGKLANVSFDINGTKYSTVEQAIQAAAAFGATDPLSVRYDLNGDGTPNFGSVTLGGIGAAPVVLTNVADGVNRYDAVNFGQLSALNDKFSDLDGRVGSLAQNAGGSGPGTPGDGSGTPGTGGPGSIVVGDGADASGANSSAIGQGSVASGSNSSAVGQGAVASGENSTSLGQGASATASGSVAIGQGSVATEANTVSFGNGTEEGNRRLVNIADGINASDAATKGQLDRAMESVDARFNDTNRAINDVAKNAYAGIAAAMAMPNMTPSAPGKTVVAVGTANFKSGSAIAAGATYRSRNGKWLVNGAASLTSVGDAGVRAQVGYEF